MTVIQPLRLRNPHFTSIYPIPGLALLRFLFLQFVTGANLLIMPKDRLELALVSTRAEVKNRQSTVDIKGISKWVFRAEAMVVERISALSSWIRGSGVTVNRKKSHTMTLREIMQRKVRVVL